MSSITGYVKYIQKPSAEKPFGGAVIIVDEWPSESKGTRYGTGKEVAKAATGQRVIFDTVENKGFQNVVMDTFKVQTSPKTAQEGSGSNNGTGSYPSSGSAQKNDYKANQEGMDYGNARTCATTLYSALITAGRLKDLTTDDIVDEIIRHTDQLVSKKQSGSKPQAAPAKKVKKEEPTQDFEDELPPY